MRLFALVVAFANLVAVAATVAGILLSDVAVGRSALDIAIIGLAGYTVLALVLIYVFGTTTLLWHTARALLRAA